jgi:DNA-binding FadR family transcriptional regulator
VTRAADTNGGGSPPTPRRPQGGWGLSRAEVIAREIEGQILEATLVDGARLGTKSDLRRQFGVAVGTVNEAVRLLETRGLVSAKPGPGGGVFVRAPSSRVRLNHLVLGLREESHTAADCLTVRNALEEPVMLEAAPACTAEDIADLRAILQELAQVADDPVAFLKVNWALHRRIAAIIPNAVLRAIYTTLLDTIEAELTAVEPDDIFEPHENLQIHVELVDALESGDRTRIHEAVERHVPLIRSL